jgi:hypothetical protein
MKRFLVIGYIFIFSVGCPRAPFHWPDTAKCSGSVGNLVGTVTQILLNDMGIDNLTTEGQKRLEQLATQYGADTVLCLVDQLVRDWSSPYAAPSEDRRMAAQRGSGFLASTRTKIGY